MNNIRVENWCGYDIRFIEINGEWWAILKDICDALNLRTDGIVQRLYPDMMTRVRIDVFDIPSRYVRSGARIHPSSNGVNSNDLNSGRGAKSFWMIAVNELGIYEALFASRRLEARKFRMWAGTVMQKLRKSVGLKQYEVMRMTEPDIQEEIDEILDDLFYDEETGKLMCSVTIEGGDVDVVEFEP